MRLRGLWTVALFALTACGGSHVTPANPAPHLRSALSPASSSAHDWTQFAYDPRRDGYNGTETLLSPSTVGTMKLKWSAHLDSNSYAQPLLVHAVTIGGAVHSVLYVQSFFKLYAIDANASSGTTASILWSKPLATSSSTCGGRTVQNGAWATPYIDIATQRIYVVDGARNFDAFNITNGSQIYSAPTFSFANGGVDGAIAYDPSSRHAYVVTALRCGLEQSDPMRGQVISYNAATGARATTFTTVTSSGYYGGSIWSMGGVAYDLGTHMLWVASGNSWPTSTTSGEHTDYAEHVIELSPSLGVAASNYPGVGQSDHDFGATPTLFQPAGCPDMAALSNKDGELLFYNRASISAGPFARIAMSGSFGDFINEPAFDPATQMLYETSSLDSSTSLYKHGLTAFSFSNCKPQRAFNFQEGIVAPTGSNAGGDVYSSPTVANGVVYFGAGTTNAIYANDARMGTALWQSPPLASRAQISPTVINGRVYVIAGGTLYAFGN